MTLNLKALVVSLALVGAAAPSSAAVITFEGFADGTVFTTQNFGAGVTFAGAQILTLGGSLNPQFPPISGVNVVYNPSGAMTLNFTTAVDFFSGYFTYNQPMLIEAFDGSNNLVDSVTGACSANYSGAGCGAPNEFLQVSEPGLISKVVISGGGGNNFTLDDANFTGSIDPGVLPEPGTIAMLLGALGVLGMTRRRRTV